MRRRQRAREAPRRCAGVSWAALLLDDVPVLELVVAVLVARLLVLGPRVHRFAAVRPLAAAVVAHDDGVRALRLVVRGGERRRPLHGAVAVAGGLAAVRDVLVDRVEREAFLVAQQAALHGERRGRGRGGGVV